MADEDRSIRVRLLAEIGNYVDGLKKASLATASFSKNLTGHGNAVKADIEKVGHTALLMSAGVAAGLALSAKAAIDWESAWAGVTKTVDGTAAQMGELEEGLRNLANELPATHGEIAAVAEAAGALGIQRGAIVDFTHTMIDLGETTNLTADQAANSIARIANVMQTPTANIERLGSTLVALGNAGASTESEILDLSQRLAAAGEIAGLSEADVLAFGSTLSSVGIDAEAGGSAISKVFTAVSDSVKDGGDKLILFGRVAGLTAGQFKAAYEKDAAGAITQFIEGLGQMIDKGESLTPVLEALEFTDIRLANALKSAASAGGLLSGQLDLGRKSWEDNTALASEAEKRYDTFAAKAEIARNQLVDLGIDVGDKLLPALSGILDVGSDVVQGLGEMDGAAGTAAAGLAGLAAAGLGAIGLIGTFGPKIKEFHDGLKNLGGIGPTLAANLGKATLALGAVGVAVGVYSYVLGRNKARQQEAIDLSKELAAAIRDETGAMNEQSEAVLAQKLGEFPGADQLRDLGADFDILIDGIRESGDALSDLSSRVQAGESITRLKRHLDEAGLSGTAFADELIRLREEGMTGTELDRFVTLLGELGGGYADATVLAANLDSAQEGVGDSADAAAGGQRRLGEDLGLTTEEAKAAEDAIRDLLDAYRASVDPLFGMLDALDKNREAQRAQAEAAAEGAERIADAQGSLKDAQDDLADARKSGDADAITAATERVADAQKNLAEVQKDAAITAEEQAAFNREAASSALDVEVAARELALAIENGTVSADNAKQMLAEWVEQGLLTADQAKDVATQFENAADKADAYAGDWVGTAVADTEEAEAAWDRLIAKAKEYLRLNPEQFSADALQAEKFGGASGAPRPTKGAATGGVVGYLGAPGPTDTEMVGLTLGEGVVNLRGMSMIGPSGLDALNSGRLLEPPAYAQTDSRSYDHSQTWAPQFVLDGSRGAQETAGAVEFRLRRMAVQVGT